MASPQEDHAPDGASRRPPVERLRLAAMVSYGAPNFAGAAMAIPIAVHLSIFYSDVVLVPLGFIAIVKAVARAFDAFTDPLMGWITDRTRTRWGRRRPWIAIGAPLAALSFIAMFSPAPGLDPLAAATWLAVSYTLYYVFHTVYQIPHYGLGPELTQNHRERATLFGVSESFVVAGTIVAGGAPWLLGEILGDVREAYASFSIAFAVALALLYLNLVWRIRERPDYVRRHPNPLAPGVRRVLRNRVFRLLLVIYGIGATTGAIPGTMMPYFSKYVIQVEDEGLWLMIFLSCYFVSAFAFMPLWVMLVRRFGKKPVWIASYTAVALGLIVLFFTVGKGDQYEMIAILVWTGATFSARAFIAPAMQADVIDYDELYTGKRREAQYGGLWSLVTKFTVIPSMSVPLAVLSSMGYEPNIEQSETVQFAIRAIFALAPAATALIALPLAIAYPIDEARHTRIVEGLEAHRRGESALDPLTNRWVAPPGDGERDDETGWFLDHFGRGELERAAHGARLAPRIALWCVASMGLCLLGGWAAAHEIQSIEREPGLLALTEIILSGLGLTSCCYHGLRLRAALRREPAGLGAGILEAHLARSDERRPGSTTAHA